MNSTLRVSVFCMKSQGLSFPEKFATRVQEEAEPPGHDETLTEWKPSSVCRPVKSRAML